MNRPIFRLYVVVLLLFAGLVAFTSRWSVLEADELRAHSDNRRPLIEEQQIARGSISTRDGVVVAESVGRGRGPQRVFERRYPQGALFGNPVGYSFVDRGRTGIELSENDLLSGERNEFASLLDQVLNRRRAGDDLTLTLDANAQRVATDALERALASTPGAEGGGAVVAIEPDTGAVRVMASVPGFNPEEARDEGRFEQLLEQGSASPLFNRATQATYEPGSTMKVVSAVAAIDSGEFDPSTVLNADSPKEISGAPLANSGNRSFGDIDMRTALTFSVNTYWAQVGEQLGAETYIEYMKRFGFYSDPPLDYPDRQMAPSGIYSEGRLIEDPGEIDIGRVAIGQERLLVTPLQMALVAATVANGGELMRPTFVEEARDPDGRVVEELDPERVRRVMSAQTAQTVTEMMTDVAEEGTASALSTSAGQLAGKTGTAEIDVEARVNRPWFIGFAPADNPRIAVAAMLERCVGCSGGAVAGPIATQVMDALAGG